MLGDSRICAAWTIDCMQLNESFNNEVLLDWALSLTLFNWVYFKDFIMNWCRWLVVTQMPYLLWVLVHEIIFPSTQRSNESDIPVLFLFHDGTIYLKYRPVSMLHLQESDTTLFYILFQRSLGSYDLS